MTQATQRESKLKRQRKPITRSIKAFFRTDCNLSSLSRAKMTFDEFQKRAAKTAVYPKAVGLLYASLGLSGESGEYANKLKKMLRDDGAQLRADRRGQLIQELGDVLWYAAACATELRVSLSDVAEQNLERLQDRHVRGVLQGEGDNR